MEAEKSQIRDPGELIVCVRLVIESCLTLGDPMDCSPPGSSVHGIPQARILEWVAILFSRGSSQPRDQTWVSQQCRFFIIQATREALVGEQHLNNGLQQTIVGLQVKSKIKRDIDGNKGELER